MKQIIGLIKELFVSSSIQAGWKLGYVQLEVLDLSLMKRFYTKTLGLSVLQGFQDSVLLGISNGSIPCIQLIQSKQDSLQTTQTYNLYYLGLKVSKQYQLGNLVNQLLLSDCSIEASSDDGYSESFFIKDPENNRIKIYWDRPTVELQAEVSKGREGEEMELPLNHFLTSSQERYREISPFEKLGQVHLNVYDLEKMEEFYTQILPFKTTFDYIMNRKNIQVNQEFFSLALNAWNERQCRRNQNQKRVHSLVFFAPSIKSIEQLAQALEIHRIDYNYVQGDLIFKDPNGTTIIAKIGDFL